MASIDIRTADPTDLPAVMNVLDAGLLDVDLDVIRRGVAAEDVLVAVDQDRVVGVCVLDPADGGSQGTIVRAIAVRRGRRDIGVGSALAAAAEDRYGSLVVHFDDRVRGFYESLGFEITATAGARFRGVR